MTAYIYAITCGDFVKIGYSANPKSRLTKINSDNIFQCRLVGFYEGDREEERAVHLYLREHRYLKEWYRIEGLAKAWLGDLALLESDAEPIKRYRSGRKWHRAHQRSLLRSLATEHGALAKWARELGLTPSALSSWRVVPIKFLPELERISGIPRSKLRPDLYSAGELRGHESEHQNSAARSPSVGGCGDRKGFGRLHPNEGTIPALISATGP